MVGWRSVALRHVRVCSKSLFQKFRQLRRPHGNFTEFASSTSKAARRVVDAGHSAFEAHPEVLLTLETLLPKLAMRPIHFPFSQMQRILHTASRFSGRLQNSSAMAASCSSFSGSNVRSFASGREGEQIRGPLSRLAGDGVENIIPVASGKGGVDFILEQSTSRAERSATDTLLKDTLLSSPGALSADIEKQYLFIADTNHHRVIIANGHGKIVDCIGSSPGMEDGTFETAQLCCPAATVFDADQNVLYIADCENHVIRRADLSTRTLNTIGRTKIIRESTIWKRFLGWIGASEPSESEQEYEMAGNSDILRYPWHLKITELGLLLVASRSFEKVWFLDSSSGEVTECNFEDSEVVSEEFCRKAIDVKEMQDVYSVIHHKMNGQQSTPENLWQISSVVDIISRVAKLHSKVFYVDTEGQMIRKYDVETGRHETLGLSNLGLLGLPHWWPLSSPSSNCVNTGSNLAQSVEIEADKLDHPIHIQPGRCLLCIYPVLPRQFSLATPLEPGSIWRQARGSVVELSMFGGSLISHKISGAQQWLDDLDDLDDLDSDASETRELTFPPQSDTGIPLYALVDASLGTGEIIVDAVLHVKYAVSQELREELRDEFGSPVEGKDKQRGLQERALQWEDQIFLKHLHVKVRLEIATTAPEERTHHVTVHL